MIVSGMIFHVFVLFVLLLYSFLCLVHGWKLFRCRKLSVRIAVNEVVPCVD